MSNRKSEDRKKAAIRIVCLVVAGVMILSIIAAAIFAS